MLTRQENAAICSHCRQRREQLDYPMFRLYDSFEEFKNRRMIPDRIDWER